MLTSLSIKNYALIEDVKLHFQENFTILTGETGAGKSIILGALALLKGKRADLSSMRNEANKCVIEGVFSIGAYDLQSVFEENDLDYETETIVRREILPSGKSRAFINDSPVNLQQLSTLGDLLVDIHSQHETLFIGDTSYQMEVVDAVADHQALLIDFRQGWKAYKKIQRKLEEVKGQQAEAEKSYDYNLFLLNEIKSLRLTEDFQETLEAQQQALSNVESLKANLGESIQLLQQEEIGLLTQLSQIKRNLNSVAGFGYQYQEIHQRLASVLIELQDLSAEIEAQEENIEDDPEKLEEVNQQLNLLYNLFRKHEVQNVTELLEIQKELEAKVRVKENATEDLLALEKELASAEAKLHQQAKELHGNRQKVFSDFQRKLVAILQQLGMPETQFDFNLSATSNFNSFGKSEINWLFSANKGHQLKEVKKAASGGELSRITLAVKSILANYINLPTIIFDEIDSGVSGEISQQMGDILEQMSEKMQVLAITHSPQIASKGQQHYKVYKEVEAGKTNTKIIELSTENRVEEIAEMLGGKQKTSSAVEHAKVLLAK
ncbi:DNA repair protein RecN [Mesonia sp. K7]|uniref:DNA repair protein RecN n=1 Tax=Mesonia sp. K7 TaxID=2218606 RepID=UPI000DA95F12|nr:DNA repair protein RecN [Mesonia sp. K7]PZD79563.1 DNA repair protein RecN [Mesonia sp. K7]